MSEVLEAARRRAELSVVDLWIAYMALGGVRTPSEVEAILAGRTAVANHDCNMLVLTLNERFADMGLDQPLPYPADPDL